MESSVGQRPRLPSSSWCSQGRQKLPPPPQHLPLEGDHSLLLASVPPACHNAGVLLRKPLNCCSSLTGQRLLAWHCKLTAIQPCLSPASTPHPCPPESPLTPLLIPCLLPGISASTVPPLPSLFYLLLPVLRGATER